MRAFRCMMAILAAMVCSASSSAQSPEALRRAVLVNHAYNVNSNITYGVANNFDLKLDVYHSREAKRPTPVVVMIHGGGWLVSNKDDYVLTAGPYLAMGFAVVNVEYRPGKISLAPASVEDCACALRWVARHAKEYNFDLDKIILTGPSAGGHLALMTGMAPASAGFANECAYQDEPNAPAPKVAAIINLFGITDVVDLLQGPNLRTYAVSWLGSAPGREDLARRISPLTYVRAGSAAHPDHPRGRGQSCAVLTCGTSPPGIDQSRSSQSTIDDSRRRPRMADRSTGSAGVRDDSGLSGEPGDSGGQPVKVSVSERLNPEDARNEIDPNPYYKWVVVGVMWLIACLNYTDRMTIFSVFPVLQASRWASPILDWR